MINKTLVLFVSLLFIKGFSQSNINFLIVENPFELRIFNKYEQNLSAKDSSSFLPFCPIQIISEDTVLSDNYTPAFIGKTGNESFYFLKPQSNLPFSKLYNSFSNFIKNAESFADTIQVVQDNKIIFYNAKEKNLQERLADSTKLVRIFKKNSKTYVKKLSPPIKYGWCDLRNKNFWINYQSDKGKKSEDITEIEFIVKEKLLETNNVLQKLFTHFNSITAKNIPIPYWALSNTKNQLVCTMLNNENNYDFTESTNTLINELHLALAHSTFSISWRENEILMYKNQASD